MVPKKENVSIAIQMDPTRVFLRIDVLPIMYISIIKIDFNFPAFYVVNEFLVQSLMVAAGDCYKTHIPSKMWEYSLPFVFSPNFSNVLLMMSQHIANMFTPL